MSTIFNSANFIIMNFPQFAGGKFISNCLSLSKYCCPQDPVTADYLINHSNDYNFRLKSVMKTIPPNRDQMKHWMFKYEFGDMQLYGLPWRNWIDGVVDSPTELVDKLIKHNFCLFITAHGGDQCVKNLLKVWPNSRIISLINHDKFRNISQNLKISDPDEKSLAASAGNYCETQYNILAGPSWPSWKEFESVGYNIQKLPGYKSVSDEILNFYNWKNINNDTFLFDVDNSIFSRSKFLNAMQNLYSQLGFTDYNAKLIEKFWRSYISLHVDNVDLV